MRAPFPARSQPRCARTPGTSSRSAVNTRVALHNIQHAGASEDRHRSVSAPRTPGAHRVLRRQDVPSLTRARRRWLLHNIGAARATATVRSRARRANTPRAFPPFRPSSCSADAQGHRSGTSDAAVSTSWGSLHCTKTVVIVCGCFVAFQSCNSLNTRNHVGAGAPKALILCSKPAYSAAPAPFGVLLGA